MSGLERYFKGAKTDDFFLELARGTTGVDFSYVNKFAENPSISSVEETIWDGDGIYPYIQTAIVLQIKSTSTLDTLLGTGARTIRIMGLDENWDFVQELIALNGTTNVPTINKYIRVFRMYVETAGSTGECQGSITANVAAVVHALILPKVTRGLLNNATFMSPFTIPRGWVGYVLGTVAGVGESKEIEATLYARGFESVWRAQRRIPLFEATFDFAFLVPAKIPNKTDVEARAKVKTGTGVISTNMTILLEKVDPTAKPVDFQGSTILEL